jgi:formyltetrahydrofolate-dependent phosphoribosylglycinamide formyltransferase
MIHNKPDCGAREVARKFGIPSAYSVNEKWMVNELKWAKVDLIILAGYMRVVSEYFVESFDHIINIHPSLLPKYKGLHAVEQALDSGDKVTGCTVHHVTKELDSGAIIRQAEVPILPDDTVETLTRRIHLQEYSILPYVIDNYDYRRVG